jgi:DUF4097 and DUF4098 domain-containing protein YvlB
MISADGIQVIEVNINQGRIRVSSTADDQLSLSSTAEMSSKRTTDTLLFDFESVSNNDQVELLLPDDIDLTITTYKGDIHVQGNFANLNLRNSAGNTLLENFQGSATLWSGRGDISVQGGGGKMVIFGEHGQLELTHFSGPASVATIMGSIYFKGVKGVNQPINLESDHGPITALLPEQSSYQLSGNTASGNLTCQGGNLELISRGCRGTTGDGQGIFTIRTVSGSIEVRILP